MPAFEISIHALLAESDPLLAVVSYLPVVFLSTLSLRRATFFLFLLYLLFVYFYPRSPCGERLFFPLALPFKVCISIHALLAESDSCYRCLTISVMIFLSTLSLRRATQVAVEQSGSAELISIHALLAESDRKYHKADRVQAYISIHALLAESDVMDTLILANTMLFLSTLSLRRATSPPSVTPTASRNFYPRSPCGERRFKL